MPPAIGWGSLGPLLLISLAIMVSPGPATISLIATGSVRGVRRSLPYLVGVIVGATTVLVAVATGITAALQALSAIGSALLAISTAYILWLAYHIATPKAAGLRHLRGRAPQAKLTLRPAPGLPTSVARARRLGRRQSSRGLCPRTG